MSDKKDKKKSKWFTKKEITTPLLILNKLLALEGDKRLQLKQEKKPNLGKAKAKEKTQEELDSERDKRKLESKEREKSKLNKDKQVDNKQVDNKQVEIIEQSDVNTKIPIIFQDIDKQYQTNLNYIIPQLNEIYLAINKKDKVDAEDNEVVITRTDVKEDETIIEGQSRIYVDEYIPPIKVSEIKI